MEERRMEWRRGGGTYYLFLFYKIFYLSPSIIITVATLPPSLNCAGNFCPGLSAQ